MLTKIIPRRVKSWRKAFGMNEKSSKAENGEREIFGCFCKHGADAGLAVAKEGEIYREQIASGGPHGVSLQIHGAI
jgi:hypothetical protein